MGGPPVSNKRPGEHRTHVDEAGRFQHEPLSREEAREIVQQYETTEQELLERYPTEKATVRGLTALYQHLRKFGFTTTVPQYIRVGIDVVPLGFGRIVLADRDERNNYWVTEADQQWPVAPLLLRRRISEECPECGAELYETFLHHRCTNPTCDVKVPKRQES